MSVITSAPSARPTLATAGLAVTAVGAALVLASFTFVSRLNKGGTTFGAIHDRLDQIGVFAAGVATAYYSWLGWLLFGVAVALAVGANLLARRAVLLCSLTVLVSALAIGFTFWAVNLLTTPVPSYTQYLGQQGAGFYLAIVGFVVIALGSVVGARRR